MMVGGVIAKSENTIEDLWVRVQSLFAEKGITCEFLFGPQNESKNGTPPRIQFEHEDGAFEFTGTRSGGGEFARMYQSCVARVWGREASRDYSLDQARAATGLVVELIGAIYATAPRYPDGLNGLEIAYSNDAKMLKRGEQFLVTIRCLFPIKWVTQEEHLANGGGTANLYKR